MLSLSHAASCGELRTSRHQIVGRQDGSHDHLREGTDRGFAAALRKIATRSRSQGLRSKKASARFSRLLSAWWGSAVLRYLTKKFDRLALKVDQGSRRPKKSRTRITTFAG